MANLNNNQVLATRVEARARGGKGLAWRAEAIAMQWGQESEKSENRERVNHREQKKHSTARGRGLTGEKFSLKTLVSVCLGKVYA